MRAAGRVLRWLGAALGVLITILAAVFGLLQTQAGRAWLARTVAQAVSDPDFIVTIDGIGGLVPFRMTIERIHIGDRDGTYLTLHDAGLDISATALLAGRAHIRSLTFSEIDMARPSTAPSTTPLIDYLEVPRLPVSVLLDRLSIGRLALAPPVLGETVIATVAGSAELAGQTAQVGLDLHRTDGASGSLLLAIELAGTAPVLSVRLDATEPTGILLDRLLDRTDRPALALSANGSGPLADWHGRVSASAGALARFDADVTFGVAADTVLAMSGTAALMPLLPAELGALVGDRVALSLRARFSEQVVVDPISIETALGTVAGDVAFGGPQKTLAAHLRATIPELSRLADLVGETFNGSATVTATATGTESRPTLQLNMSGTEIRFGPSGADRVEAEISATPPGFSTTPKPAWKSRQRAGSKELSRPRGLRYRPSLVATSIGRSSPLPPATGAPSI
jgi:translocation and assembly module TamB